MQLKGWRTYIAAALVFITGLLEFVDEVAAADYIGGYIGLEGSIILMACGAVFGILRKLTDTPAKI